MYIFQPDRFLLRQSVKKFGRHISGDVLDVGAGEYDRYKEFINPSKYVRMDIKKGAGVDVVGRAEAAPFEDNSFDSVVCTQVFEHLDKPERASQEIFRILKPGGKLLLTVPQVNELHEEPFDFFRYTNYGIKALLEKAGFKIIVCEPRGGYFTVMAQMHIRYRIDSWNLYNRPLLGRLYGQWSKIYGHSAILHDLYASSSANRKHTLGWIVVAQK